MIKSKLIMTKSKLIVLFCLMFFSAICQSYPKLERQDVANCVITNIVKNSYATTIYFKYTPNSEYKSGIWVCINKDIFIEDVNTKKRFHMLKANNIPVCPSKHEFSSANEEFLFQINFEPINETNKINIIENEFESAFNFYGVEVLDTKTTLFNMETSSIYLVTALFMSLLFNFLFRKKLNVWVIFLSIIIPNLIIGLIVQYVFAISEYERVYFSFNRNNIWGQFAESFVNTIFAFIIIAPFFRSSIQKSKTIKTDSNANKSKLNPLESFKNLNLGIYRLLIAGWIIIPLVVGLIAAVISDSDDKSTTFTVTLIFTISGYYLLARLSAWVILGFKKDNPEHQTSDVKLEENIVTVESLKAKNEIVQLEYKPKSFYFSILLIIFFVISISFIFMLFDQISNYKESNTKLNEKIITLIDDLKFEKWNYKINSLVGSKTASEECDIDYELEVENKLDITVRIYISRPLKTDSEIKWEQFSDFYWQLESGYSGKLSLDNKTLKVGGYRYYITDLEGNFIVGSPKRPVYGVISDNTFQGLKIY